MQCHVPQEVGPSAEIQQYHRLCLIHRQTKTVTAYPRLVPESLFQTVPEGNGNILNAVMVIRGQIPETDYVEADTAFFRTMGIEVLKGLPQELIQSDAIFLSQRFAKEIAIRKVNGASAGDILRLLSRGVLLIAVPCVVVGSVVAWYVGTEWLTQFAGQVSISPLHFVGLAVLLLVIIVCIVVVKAWHIANENPVESIKSE